MDINPNRALEMSDLARAFNEARLAVLHVDMQLKFHENFCIEGRIPTKEVFPIVRDFASNLRNLNIRNHWIAYTGHWDKTLYKDFKTGVLKEGRYNLSKDLRMYPNMGVQDDEMVFEKAQQWAFRNENCILTDHLIQEGADTLIIDGVKDKHCIAGTIATGLKKGFRIYTAMDATNCPKDQFYNYAEWFLKPGDLTPEQKSQITFTTTDEILSTLRQAQVNQQQLPVRSFANG